MNWKDLVGELKKKWDELGEEASQEILSLINLPGENDLETNLRKATCAAHVAGVYWCARALKAPSKTGVVGKIEKLIDGKGVYIIVADHHFIAFIYKKEDLVLFNWDNTPGSGDEKLLSFLRDDMKVGWIERTSDVQITKSDDGKTIKVTDGNNVLRFRIKEDSSPHITVDMITDEVVFSEDTAISRVLLEALGSDGDFHCFGEYTLEYIDGKRCVIDYDGKEKITYKSIIDGSDIELYIRTICVSKAGGGYIKIAFNKKRNIEVISRLSEVIKFRSKLNSFSVTDLNSFSDFIDMYYEAIRDWCEGHLIPPAHLGSDKELMRAIEEKVHNFIAHYEGGDTVDYSLLDSNCETFVNSVLKVLGYSEDIRERLGEFSGIDWAEEDLIPDRFFEKPIYIGNSNTLELHVPGCKWASLISDDHRVIFYTVDEALKQGYNGCYYCLKRFDTDKNRM